MTEPNDLLARIGNQLVALGREFELIHSARRWAADPLAAEVEHRAVARTFELPGAVTEFDTTAEVWAFLRQRKEMAIRVCDIQATLIHERGRALGEVGSAADLDLAARPCRSQRAEQFP